MLENVGPCAALSARSQTEMTFYLALHRQEELLLDLNRIELTKTKRKHVHEFIYLFNLFSISHLVQIFESVESLLRFVFTK